MKSVLSFYHEDIVILTLTTNSFDATNCREIKEEIQDVIHNIDNKKVILNLPSVRFIDSSGIGVLISIMRQCNNRQNIFILVNLYKNIIDLLALLRLDKVFTVYNTPEEAKNHYANCLQKP